MNFSLPDVPFRIVVRNTAASEPPPHGLRLRNHGHTLVVKSANGDRLATLKRGQAVAITADAKKPRRKLRRIGGSDRLWRALRGGR